jgi:hypothetical protein
MDLDFEAWLLVGYEKKWISDVFCDTHEGAPMTDEEANEWEAGFDPCSFHVKIYGLD